VSGRSLLASGGRDGQKDVDAENIRRQLRLHFLTDAAQTGSRPDSPVGLEQFSRSTPRGRFQVRHECRDAVEDALQSIALEFGGEVRLDITAAVSPEVVYRALTEPDQLSRWMMADNATVEPAVGGRYDLGWPEGWGRPLAIVDLEPDKRLTYSWADPAIEGTVVTWELEGSHGATRITLVHSGFGAEAASQGGYYGGWADFLVRLKWMVEKGAAWVGPKWVAP